MMASSIITAKDSRLHSLHDKKLKEMSDYLFEE